MELKKAAFLDRDGVICEFINELADWNHFKLRKGIVEAIQLLNAKGYYVFVATNQPNVAKAKMTMQELLNFHQKMKDLLESNGAKLDDIFFCPHRMVDGGGVISEYAVDCDCRKPKPGMLEQAAAKYAFVKEGSFMLGDTWRDAGCASHFGIPCLGLTGGGGFPYRDEDEEANYKPLQIFDGPLAAVQWWLSRQN